MNKSSQFQTANWNRNELVLKTKGSSRA